MRTPGLSASLPCFYLNSVTSGSGWDVCVIVRESFHGQDVCVLEGFWSCGIWECLRAAPNTRGICACHSFHPAATDSSLDISTFGVAFGTE